MTDHVRIWIVPVSVPAGTVAGCQELLDAGERARAAAFTSPRDRQRFEVAHGALRLLAGRELGARAADLTWTAGPHGKPALTPPWSALHTSLSHSGDMIAVAVCASRPVGVDIQDVLPGLDTAALSARFFPAAESRYIAAGGGTGVRSGRFADLWARKEAVVKAAGSRLWPNLSIEVHGRDVVSCADPPGPYRVAGVPVPAGFRAAVALAGEAPFVTGTAAWPPASPDGRHGLDRGAQLAAARLHREV